jgi:hypothetical protein
VTSLTAGLASLTAAYALLANANKPANPAPTNARLPARPNLPKTTQKFAPNGYCWTVFEGGHDVAISCSQRESWEVQGARCGGR